MIIKLSKYKVIIIVTVIVYPNVWIKAGEKRINKLLKQKNINVDIHRINWDMKMIITVLKKRDYKGRF